MNKILVAVALALVAFGAIGCGVPEPQTNQQSEAARQAERSAATRSFYIPKNDVEGLNYNRRQELADDPAAIIWCTAYPSQPGAPILTFPIVGKLTSGDKRPYSTSRTWTGDDGTHLREQSPEVPGPDGMYGSSGEYRYGFTPADVYVDFYNLETFCTSAPLVIQRETSSFALTIDPELGAAHDAARAALQSGDTEDANRILDNAINCTGC